MTIVTEMSRFAFLSTILILFLGFLFGFINQTRMGMVWDPDQGSKRIEQLIQENPNMKEIKKLWEFHHGAEGTGR